MSYELPNRSKPAQIQIMFHKKKPQQDFIGKTLQTRGSHASYPNQVKHLFGVLKTSL